MTAAVIGACSALRGPDQARWHRGTEGTSHVQLRSSIHGSASSSALTLLGGARAALADDDCVVFDAARQSAKTPDQALQRLMDGNARLLAGKTVNCDLLAQIEATAAGQAPFAAIVGCINSRVPPELVFDQRLGSVFAARIAGNFVNTDIIGSLEFATKVVGRQADRGPGPFRMRRDQGCDRQCPSWAT